MTTVTEPIAAITGTEAADCVADQDPESAHPVSDDDALPELELISARHDDAEPMHVVWLDPADVSSHKFNRGSAGELEHTFTDEELADLLASVPVVGFLQPAVVTAHPELPGKYVALIGHRRRAAAQRLGRKLPAIVAESDQHVQQILAILFENEHRLGLRPSQKADLYHQLTLDGWSASSIARAEGVKPERVKATLSLVDLPAQARQAADGGQLDLFDAADLAKVGAEDPAVLAKIIEKGAGKSNQWGFKHAISDAKAKIKRDEAADQIFAELITAGVKVTKKPKDFPYTSREAAITDLTDAEGNRLDAETVRTQAGWAAFIDKQSPTTPTAVYYCLDPEHYGYRRRSPSRYVSPDQLAARQEADRAAQAFAQALEVAAQVRQQFLTTHFGAARTAKACQQQALRDAIANPDHISYTASLRELGDAIAGCDLLAKVEAAGADRLARMLVARWVCSDEQNLIRVLAGQRWDIDPARALTFLDRLTAAGYELSEAEQRAHATLSESLADHDNAEDDTDEAEDDDEDE